MAKPASKTLAKTTAKNASKTITKTVAKAAAKPAMPAKSAAKPVEKPVLKPAAVTQAAPKQFAPKAAPKAAAKPGQKAAKAVATQVSKIAANIAAKAAAKDASKTKNGSAKPAQAKGAVAKPAPKIELSESELAALTMIRTFSPPVQPAEPLEPEAPKVKYKYQVGDAVYFTSPSFGRAAASGTYTVIKVLPSDGEDHQYRIKSSVEAFERVAKESQLERI